MTREGDEEGRLVLAIPGIRLQYLRGEARLIAADAERYRHIANILRDPAIKGMQRVHSFGIAHDPLSRLEHCRRQFVSALRQPRVPATDIRPRARTPAADPLHIPTTSPNRQVTRPHTRAVWFHPPVIPPAGGRCHDRGYGRRGSHATQVKIGGYIRDEP